MLTQPGQLRHRPLGKNGPLDVLPTTVESGNKSPFVYVSLLHAVHQPAEDVLHHSRPGEEKPSEKLKRLADENGETKSGDPSFLTMWKQGGRP